MLGNKKILKSLWARIYKQTMAFIQSPELSKGKVSSLDFFSLFWRILDKTFHQIIIKYCKNVNTKM